MRVLGIIALIAYASPAQPQKRYAGSSRLAEYITASRQGPRKHVQKINNND